MRLGGPESPPDLHGRLNYAADRLQVIMEGIYREHERLQAALGV